MLPTGFDLCVSHSQFRVLLACSSCQLHHFLLPGVSVRGWDSLLVRVLGSGLKGCKFESPQEQGENFFSPELTLCADSYSVSVPPPCYHSGT